MRNLSRYVRPPTGTRGPFPVDPIDEKYTSAELIEKGLDEACWFLADHLNETGEQIRAVPQEWVLDKALPLLISSLVVARRQVAFDRVAQQFRESRGDVLPFPQHTGGGSGA
jgi:hypothetical protein